MIQLKYELPILKFFLIKYGIEWFEERNNFPYMNFFRFKEDLN
jgi:hypothetical protein